MTNEEHKLEPCPMCGAGAYMAREHDPDDIAWAFIRCQGCGVRTRGKWYSTGNDCPQLYAEVRDEWNIRSHLQQRPLPVREGTDYEAIPPEIDARLSVWLTLGKELHPLTINLVVRFARALAAKLADAEKKYGYSDGWRSPDWMDECRAHLMEHVHKGDPRDVAAYCAFLWHHGESTASPSLPVREEPTWQPIETAPKDGTPVLIFGPGTSRPALVRWTKEPEVPCWRSMEYWSYDEEEVDHWMPLPAAPSTDKEGAGGKKALPGFDCGGPPDAKECAAGVEGRTK